GGCMNTVGNLGGFVAGFLTGWIIDRARAPAIPDAAAQVASSIGAIGGSLGVGANPAAQVAPLSQLGPQLLDAARPGWTINFIIFGSVYIIATLLWLRFDSTKPVVPDEANNGGADRDGDLRHAITAGRENIRK